MADDCSNIVCPKPVDSNPVDLASLAQTQTCFGFLWKETYEPLVEDAAVSRLVMAELTLKTIIV